MQKSTLVIVLLVFVSACEKAPTIKTTIVPKPTDIASANSVPTGDGKSGLPAGHPPMMSPADPLTSSPDSPLPASVIPSANGPFTMLGAILPVKDEAWFYKVSGSADQIALIEESLINFLKSTKFENGQPVLTSLPDDWKLIPGSGMRFATIQIPRGDNVFEMSVSKLLINGPWEEYTLLNINRWRNQLGLSEVKLDELFSDNENEVVEDIPTSVGQARYVRLTGPKNPNASGMSAPFMNR